MRALRWILMLTCLAAGYTQATHPSDVEANLIALERVRKPQAWQSKDLKTLDAICDGAFVYVDPEGRMRTKLEVMAYIRRIDLLQFTAEEMTVKLHGQTAIVTGLYRMKGTDRGESFIRSGRFVDTWLYKNERWVAIASLLAPAGN